jgi:ornithine--oxo-acid transaminase
LGGGVYPVSIVLSDAQVLGVFSPGDHGSTFGGNPLGAAVAIASLDVILDEHLAENAREVGAYFVQKLKALASPAICEIRTRGLMIGVQINREYGKARDFCLKLMDEGLLCKDTHENTIRFTPPLIITKQDIDEIMPKISKVLS